MLKTLNKLITGCVSERRQTVGSPNTNQAEYKLSGKKTPEQKKADLSANKSASFEQMYDNSVYVQGNTVDGRAPASVISQDLQCVSIQILDVEIQARFGELKKFAEVQLGFSHDSLPVSLAMLQTLYQLKMQTLQADARVELAKFDAHLAARIRSEHKRLHLFKVY